MRRITKGRLKILMAISLLGLILTGIQLLIIYFKGEALCLNEGCVIVEEAVTIEPLVMNVLGMAYFGAIFLFALFTLANPAAFFVLQLLLLAGLAAEGILLGFQATIAGAFCYYCLAIFSIILALSIGAGLKPAIQGLTVTAMGAAAFVFLMEGSQISMEKNLDLNNGTYAIQTCSDPAQKLFLIFSTKCPHCRQVLNALQGCTRCEFRFNPINKIQKDFMPGLTLKKEYNTYINKAALKMLGINSIPVLVVREAKGITLITGDKNIISYIKATCFNQKEHNEPQPLFQPDQFFEKLTGSQSGACSLEEECPEERP